jgi:hypothetical protein
MFSPHMSEALRLWHMFLIVGYTSKRISMSLDRLGCQLQVVCRALAGLRQAVDSRANTKSGDMSSQSSY